MSRREKLQKLQKKYMIPDEELINLGIIRSELKIIPYQLSTEESLLLKAISHYAGVKKTDILLECLKNILKSEILDSSKIRDCLKKQDRSNMTRENFKVPIEEAKLLSQLCYESNIKRSPVLRYYVIQYINKNKGVIPI